MLNKYLERAQKEGKTIDEMAKTLVDEYMDAGRPVMGMGQPQHIDSDPWAEPIHLKQEELELKGVYLEFQRAMEKHFHARRKADGRSYWCECGGFGQHRADGNRFFAQCGMVYRQCIAGI